MRYAAMDCIRPDRDLLRCLPESREEKQRLLDSQGAFGIGAYDNDVFGGSLWFYRIEERGLANPWAPPWSGWGRGSEGAGPRPAELDIGVPFPGLSCFHVGRTKALEREDRNDESCYGKGIGSGLLVAAMEWAVQRDYRAIVATSGIDAFPEFNKWAGMLPLKAFLRQRFDVLYNLDAAELIPNHLREATPGRQLVQAVVAKRIHR